MYIHAVNALPGARSRRDACCQMFSTYRFAAPLLGPNLFVQSQSTPVVDHCEAMRCTIYSSALQLLVVAKRAGRVRNVLCVVNVFEILKF